MQNFDETILSQYGDSPTLNSLIAALNGAIDPSVDIANFYSNIWDISTAVGQGLDDWGQIVNISRILKIPASPPQLGFHNGPGLPLNQAPFNNGVASTQNYALSDSAYRTLILVKAAANISNATAPNINALLQFLFAGDGRCYVQDTGGMTQRYVFEFTLTPAQLSIMLFSGAIPRPAGVQAYVYQTNAPTTFAFNGGTGQPFGQGVFDSMSNLQPTA